MKKDLIFALVLGLALGTILGGVAIGVSSCNKKKIPSRDVTEFPVYIETSERETETETEAPTTIAPTTVTPTEPSTEPSLEPVTGVIEVDPSAAKTMYTITNVNVRMGPSLDDMIITTLYTGKDIQVCEIGNDEWAVVILDEQYYYINKNFISDTPPATEPPATTAPTAAPTQPSTTPPPSTPVNKTDAFHYYGIYTSQYWHFTPEQIDAQWAGYKSYKPALPNGTTRAWQAYLYQKLSERGFGWWYTYACAQAMQESGFNPLADNGVDYGLFSFRLRYWDSSYGSVYDYKANINAYVDRISKYLIGVTTDKDIYMALSQHYLPDGQLHMNYVNAVLARLNELWICD